MTRGKLLLAAVLVGLVLLGAGGAAFVGLGAYCADPVAAEAPSPDGQYLAPLLGAGPCDLGPATITVEVERTSGWRGPFTRAQCIFGYPGSVEEVTLTWPTPRLLNIAYRFCTTVPGELLAWGDVYLAYELTLRPGGLASCP